MYSSLKEQAYEANMQLWHKGLVVLTWGNVSAVDREAGVMAIKPSGVAYEALSVHDMVVVSLADGQTVEGKLRPSSDTATHLTLYRGFPQIGGVAHTHSRYATIWAQAGRSIPCFGTTHCDSFYGDVVCTAALSRAQVEGAYEEWTGRVILEAFADRDPLSAPAALVKQHGPFTWGKDARDAVQYAVILEETAMMALYTLSLSPGCEPVCDFLLDKHYYRKHGPGSYYGQAQA